MTIETHPLEPFLPKNAKILFLGSFPPPNARWIMEFFYPNWINDFWRIQGLIHFNDKEYFYCRLPLGEDHKRPRRFDKDRIEKFCLNKGLAFYDMALKVRRLKENADDNFLEVIERTDVFGLLETMPNCRILVTTGGKASEELQKYMADSGILVKTPKVGEKIEIELGKIFVWWRMPSSSRAYPMKLEKKAECYKRLFI